MITAAQIKKIAPTARADLVAAIVRGWPEAEREAKINTPLRAQHFLAQAMAETGGLTILSESGAYKYESILKIFGARQYSVQYGGKGHSAGVTPAEAKKIAALPVAQRGPVLFERVYGLGNPKKAKELGNINPGDGWKYRGGGVFQCTGGANYLKFQKKTGIPVYEHPELLHQPDSAFKSAWQEWGQDGRCNKFADDDDVTGVTKVINGGTNGLDTRKLYLARAKTALKGFKADSDAAPVGLLDAGAAEPSQDADPSPADIAPAPPAPADPSPAAPNAPPPGDPDKFSIQTRLKAMNYNPGLPNGVWGGMTGGAISGFINDRGLAIVAPTSAEMFDAVADDLKTELSRAEAENFTRPVSEQRASGDAATVAQVAPEVVPVQRNFLMAAWGAFVTFLTAIWNAISGYVADAWDFFTDHKDSLPADPGLLKTAWSYVAAVPTFVWIVAVGAGLVLIAINSSNAVKRITETVKTGARQ